MPPAEAPARGDGAPSRHRVSAPARPLRSEKQTLERQAMTSEQLSEQPAETTVIDSSDPRALTLENVERTLDELRPYLMADGGNVEVVEIDGPIVKVRLQGACGSCPSSTMTLKMGIERKLREAIPEVSEVVQVL
ncbi:MAG: hypothetical protein RLZZ611_601 [Cyanobacteriota bacterium]|jgi:Fe-S cluster biogenesis protein NfuA